MSAAIIILASFGLGLAVWLVPASVQIASWSRDGIGRIAVFAPLYTLWMALAVSLIVAVLLWFGGDRSAHGRNARARAMAPGVLLWLWTIPFLPWAGDRFPLVLILAGPLRWLIASAAAAGLLYRWCRLRGWTFALPRWPGRKTVFVVSLALYLVLGLRSLSVLGLGGDEPHYLVITHSLLVDHDLKIENNHARGDYRAFFGGDLRPDYLQRGINGEIYSIHAPGLSALLLPGYAIAGSAGAVATACLLAALAALAIFDVAGIIGGPATAWVTWLGVCLTVPFVPHAWSLYPEVAALAIVAWTVSWCLESAPAGLAAWFGRGLCLSILPWLHTKFIVILAALTLWLLVRLRAQLKSCVALLVPIVLSGISWLTFFYVVYGRLDPQAPYGSYANQFVKLENLPRSVLGMLFDQKFGLVVYAPIYLLAVWGAWLLLRDVGRRGFAVALIGIALLFSLTSARYYMWWGGSSAPARFLVPIVPLVAPMVAAAITRARGPVRANVWLLVVLSLLVPAAAVAGADQLLLFSDPHGSARLLQHLQGSVPLTTMMPTFTDEDWRSPVLHVWPWLGAAVAAAIAAALAARRRTSPLMTIAAEGITFLVVAAVLAGPVPAEARNDAVTRGHLALMDAFDPTRSRAFDYATFAKIPPDTWLARSRIVIDLDPSHPADGYGRLASPVTLAPGHYEVKVWFRGDRPHTGDLILAVHGGRILRRIQGPLPNPAAAIFALPVEIPEVSVQLTDLVNAQSAARVEFIPMSVVPASQRLAADAHAVEAIPGPPDAYIVYTDDRTFPEGGVFWTRSTSRGEVLVMPAGAKEMALTLHVGPTGGLVRIGVSGQSQDVQMDANETRTLTVPIAHDAPYVAVTVASSRAFRPASVDPKSTDARSLGCQVRIELR